MNLLIDYIQPLTHWLQQNPHWALLITFLMALTESLAIIGSIVPGSVTMTAVGIMAGSGIMRVDLTLLAAILGAVVGDSLSYALGYIYSDRLAEIWPFKKYPQWLQYGKGFFAVHGGKSVFLGRFIGPLRSIIPVIAGILHMKQWRFLIANILSAIGWSLLYVMPGVIIGAASHELSAESATRLFILILLILAGIWLSGSFLKWGLSKASVFLKRYLHSGWLKLKNKAVFRTITPKEKNHDQTASIALTASVCFLCFMILLGLTLQERWITLINLPIHLFIQSFHASTLEAFFIFCTQLTSTLTLVCLFIICCCWFLYRKDIKTLFYLCSLILLTTLTTLILRYWVDSPRPPGLLVLLPGSSFPAVHIMIAASFYGFILFYINHIHPFFTNTLRTCVFTILGFSGLGALYLGNHWLSDLIASYFAGAVICLIYCLRYRKTHFNPEKLPEAFFLIYALLIGIILSTSFSTYFNFQTLAYNHTPYHKEFLLSETAWWNQKKPILPIYRLNRIGKRISLLNIEYAGDLNLLKENLTLNGWKVRTESFLMNLLTWINNQSDQAKLPLLTQLYENKAPSLMMTYTASHSKLNLELRMWESNYRLTESQKPLWIGSIHPSIPLNSKTARNPAYFPKLIDPSTYLLANPNSFMIKKITLPEQMIKTTTYTMQPYILLIKVKNNPSF